jgi:16S rRNA (cytidine1402-2'-O)-methyltransferase
VCRELTKRFEEVVRGPLSVLSEHYAEPPRGEVTLVLAQGSPSATSRSDEAAGAAVAELVRAGTPRRTAADVVARLTGSSRNALYRDSL